MDGKQAILLLSNHIFSVNQQVELRPKLSDSAWLLHTPLSNTNTEDYVHNTVHMSSNDRWDFQP